MTALLTYVTFASLGFNALTVAALIVLRRTRASAARPYRTWGYPVTPAARPRGGPLRSLYIFAGDPRDAPAPGSFWSPSAGPPTPSSAASGARPGDRLSVAISAEITAQDGVARHVRSRGSRFESRLAGKRANGIASGPQKSAMANKTVHLPVAPLESLGGTLRKDNWWAGPTATVVVLSGFIVYATWRAFEGSSYEWGAYLSPFYLAAARRVVGPQAGARVP